MKMREAMQQATRDVTMYRQGNQWVVSTYDPQVAGVRVSRPCSYRVARELRTANRAYRIIRLLGGSHEQAWIAQNFTGGAEWRARRATEVPLSRCHDLAAECGEVES